MFDQLVLSEWDPWAYYFLLIISVSVAYHLNLSVACQQTDLTLE